MRTNTRKNGLSTPKSGKCNLIEGILLGGGETNALNAKNSADDHKPHRMIGKLTMTAQNSNDPTIRAQAEKAIELLELLRRDTPANESDRRRIFEHVSVLKAM